MKKDGAIKPSPGGDAMRMGEQYLLEQDRLALREAGLPGGGDSMLAGLVGSQGKIAAVKV